MLESNQRPRDYESPALTAELTAYKVYLRKLVGHAGIEPATQGL